MHTPSTGIMLLGVGILSLVWLYFPFIGAYRWFDGPAVTVDAKSEAPINGGEFSDLEGAKGEVAQQ